MCVCVWGGPVPLSANDDNQQDESHTRRDKTRAIPGEQAMLMFLKLLSYYNNYYIVIRVVTTFSPLSRSLAAALLPSSSLSLRARVGASERVRKGGKEWKGSEIERERKGGGREKLGRVTNCCSHHPRAAGRSEQPADPNRRKITRPPHSGALVRGFPCLAHLLTCGARCDCVARSHRAAQGGEQGSLRGAAAQGCPAGYPAVMCRSVEPHREPQGEQGWIPYVGLFDGALVRRFAQPWRNC